MWTESQFKAQLRKEGWRHIAQGVYEHPNVKHDFQCNGWSRKYGKVNWRVWAEVEQTPAPF